MKMKSFIQKARITALPFNSYYSYRNPDTKKIIENIESDEVRNNIYNEVTHGLNFLKRDITINLFKEVWEDDVNNIYGNICPYYNKLKNMAEYFLYTKDCKFYINENLDENTEQMLFHEFSIEGEDKKLHSWLYFKQMIYQDIIKAMYFVEKGLSDKKRLYYMLDIPVSASDTVIDRMLEKGLSETHLHTGAGREFSYAWLEVMNAQKENYFNDIKTTTFEGIKSLKNLLGVASIVRMVMALYVKSEDSYEKLDGKIKNILLRFENGDSFEKDKKIFSDKTSFIDEIGSTHNIDFKGFEDYFFNDDNMDENDNFANKVLKSDRLSFVFDKEFEYYPQENKFCANEFYNFYLPETILMLKVLKKMKKGIQSENDKSIFALFWQYIKVKNIFYNYIVQQFTSGKGLEIFEEKYRRHSRTSNFEFFSEEVMHGYFRSQKMKKLEMRITPKYEIEKMKQELKGILTGYYSLLQSSCTVENNLPLLGIVYHFVKKEDKNSHCISDCKESTDMTYINYGEEQKNIEQMVENILKIKEEIPKLSYYMVGIDSAGMENKAEPFVFKKAFEKLRDEDVYSKQSIGFTYHAGEDFYDIISGLRHIDELIEKFRFRAGDRVGHGIVLGIDIEKWGEMNSIVYLPAQEYLENLLWEWGLYNNSEDYKNTDNIGFIENIIIKTAKHIFGFTSGITVRDLYEIYNEKFESYCGFNCNNCTDCGNEICINSKIDCSIMPCSTKCINKNTEIKYKMKENPRTDYCDNISWDKKSLKKAFHCSFFRKEMKRNVKIEITNSLKKKYKILQEFMMKKINSHGIVIEVNPTSNLIIGEFENYKDYHIENLSSPKQENVIITINSDDPIIFATNLSNEYCLISDFMMKTERYSKKEIVEWLERIRENGMKYSFIRDRGLSKEKLIEELREIIKDLDKC